jgi:signal transduction histidine kinase
MERADAEAALEDWFDDAELEPPEELPALVELGIAPSELSKLLAVFDTELPRVLDVVATHSMAVGLLNEICHGSDRILSLVQALKSYTYLDRGKVQEIDVNKGIEDTLVMLRSLLKKGTSVTTDLAENLPPINGRGGELNQVWTNIVDNAVSAMDGEGTLAISSKLEGEQILVRITDSGPGIPEEIQPLVFDPFFTTKKVGVGTGLGLNISRNIVVEKHNGEISVQSRPGQTTFLVRLPISGATPAE